HGHQLGDGARRLPYHGHDLFRFEHHDDDQHDDRKDDDHHDRGPNHDLDDQDQHDHHAAADHDHQHDHTAGDLHGRLPHPHGVPHPDGELRLVEHPQQPVSPVHQPHAAAARFARGAVLHPAQPAPEPTQLPLARGGYELRHPQRQLPVEQPPEHHQSPRRPARGGGGLVAGLPGEHHRHRLSAQQFRLVPRQPRPVRVLRRRQPEQQRPRAAPPPARSPLLGAPDGPH